MLDAGGFSNLFHEVGRIKTETILELNDLMGVDAVNISARELSNDADLFEELSAGRKTPYISANIVEEESGNPRFKTHVRITFRDKTIAVIGITGQTIKTWDTADGRTLVVADPAESLLQIVNEVASEVDYIILLAHYSRHKLGSLLEKVHGIDLVLGADGYSLTREIDQVGETRVSYAGIQGQCLGTMELSFGEKGVENLDHEMVLLELDLPEDPEVKSIVDATLKRIEEKSPKES